MLRKVDANVEVLMGGLVRTAGNQSRALTSVAFSELIEQVGKLEVKQRVIPSDPGHISMSKRLNSVREPDSNFVTQLRKGCSQFDHDSLAAAQLFSSKPVTPITLQVASR